MFFLCYNSNNKNSIMVNFIVTSEQVGRGHPDKLCDQISDFILNRILNKDKDARVAVEAAAGKNKFFITGEVKTNFNYKKNLVKDLKEMLSKIDSSYKKFKFELNISQQSPEINLKVDKEERLGAGDQGLMYGYATNETNSFLPIPYALSTFIISEYEKKFPEVNENYKFDSKSQVCYNYTTKKLINVNLSVQHSNEIELEELQNELKEFIKECVTKFEKEQKLSFKILDKDTQLIVNNAGTFILGGAIADAGLTGRKVIADTYGGLGRHGGGAFSGKDYTKVDRSAAYYARYVARKIVEAKLTDICEIQVSYIIGQEEPVAINIETFDTEKKSLDSIKKYISDNFDFSLDNIIKELDLKNVDYTQTTLYGHFGKKHLKWG